MNPNFCYDMPIEARLNHHMTHVFFFIQNITEPVAKFWTYNL